MKLSKIAVAGSALAALLWAGAAEAQRFRPDFGARSTPLLAPRYKVFDIEWRLPLVERGLLQYAPQQLAGPAVDDLTGEIVVATSDGAVRLLTSTGRTIWLAQLDAPAMSAPLMTEDAIFLGDANGNLVALDRFAGDRLWKTYVGGAVIETPSYENGRVFAGTDHDAVHALDAGSGESRWVYRHNARQQLSIRGGTGATVTDGKLYAGFSDGTVVALATDEGRLLWEAPLAAGAVDKFPDSDATPVVHAGSVYVTVYNEGVYALDAADGKVRWQTAAPGATSLGLANELLLVGGSGNARALHLGSGAPVWSVDLGRGYVTRPMAVDRMVVMAGDEGMIFLEQETGKPLRIFDPGSAFATSPAVRGKTVYALSNLGFFYALRTVVGER